MQDFKTLHFKLFNFFYSILQETPEVTRPEVSVATSNKSQEVVAFDLVALNTYLVFCVVVVLAPPTEV